MICGNLCSAVCIDADCNIVNTCYVVICLQPVSKDENLPKGAFFLSCGLGLSCHS